MKRMFLCLIICMSAWAQAFSDQSGIVYKPIQRGKPKQTESKFIHIPVKEATSSNWSGYVTTTSNPARSLHSVSYVTGTWVVPAVNETEGDSYSSVWVGIDGYSSGTVEQLGTEQDWVSGAAQYYAWFEMYPGGAYSIEGFPVNPGDQIQASVEFIGGNSFELTMSNLTHGTKVVIPHSYTRLSGAKRSSAEWIIEAPYSEGVLPLADFNPVTFSNCRTIIADVNGVLGFGRWKNVRIDMENNSDELKDSTSNLNNTKNGFTVSWLRED